MRTYQGYRGAGSKFECFLQSHRVKIVLFGSNFVDGLDIWRGRFFLLAIFVCLVITIFLTN